MNLTQLANAVTAREGLKKQINITQVREIIKVVSIVMYMNPKIIAAMLDLGQKHFKKAGK